MNNKAAFKTLDGLIGPIEKISADLQSEIDELEDKQSGRATEARQEKIDGLQELIDLLESATDALTEARDKFDA